MATVQTFALCSVSVVDNVPPRTPVVRYVRENISHDILYASNGEQVISPSGLSGDLGNKQWKFVTVQEVSINSLMEKITAMEQKHITDMELMGATFDRGGYSGNAASDIKFVSSDSPLAPCTSAAEFKGSEFVQPPQWCRRESN